MITFTSETPGSRNAPERRPCPRCERDGPLEISMRTARVIFYRCPECGHMWIVKIPQPEA